jgi:hypothetical protein
MGNKIPWVGTPDERKEFMFSAHEEYDRTGDRGKLIAYESTEWIRDKKPMSDIVVDEYTDIVNQYPPHVQEFFGVFLRTFLLPKASVPVPSHKKSATKKNGRYAEWITQLEYLIELCDHRFMEAVPLALDRYEAQKTDLKRPASLNSIFTTVISEMKRENANKMARVLTDDVDPAVVDRDVARSIRREFESED